jgi:hypothetical protein
MEGHLTLEADYFANKPTRITKDFLAVLLFVHGLCGSMITSSYARKTKPERFFPSILKCTGAKRYLAYEAYRHTQGDYLHMSESTCIESMCKFHGAVVEVFGSTYLKAPKEA